MVTLDFAQLVEQRVVLIIADRRIVLNVIALVVLAQLVAQLISALGLGAHDCCGASALSS